MLYSVCVLSESSLVLYCVVSHFPVFSQDFWNLDFLESCVFMDLAVLVWEQIENSLISLLFWAGLTLPFPLDLSLNGLSCQNMTTTSLTVCYYLGCCYLQAPPYVNLLLTKGKGVRVTSSPPFHISSALAKFYTSLTVTHPFTLCQIIPSQNFHLDAPLTQISNSEGQRSPTAHEVTIQDGGSECKC